MTTNLFGPPGSTRRDWAIALAGMLGTVVFTHVLYGEFFPGPNGVGHDYASVLTVALAEYFWAVSESPWVPPAFTPAFCGGIPLYADPQNSFFSIPAVLTRFAGIDPLQSHYVTFLLFVAFGFAGTYLLARRRLDASVAATFLAAFFFGLNSFLPSRTMVGHTMFHGLMLVPALAWALTAREPASAPNWRAIFRVIVAALIMSYWVYSGGSVMVIPFALATLLLMALAWWRGRSILTSITMGIAALTLALALSASKLVAVLAYMQSFPREGYLLPGYVGAFEALQVLFSALFTNAVDLAGYSQARLTNSQWALDRHELEFGVTAVPLVLVILALLAKLIRNIDPPPITSDTLFEPAKARRQPLLSALVILVVLTVPAAINVYGDSWNAFLKSLPLIGSSSSLLRWFVVYVPFVAIVGGLVLDHILSERKQRATLALVAVLGTAVILLATDRGFYRQQGYDPKPVLSVFETVRSNPANVPAIRFIGAFIGPGGDIQLPMNRQDVMLQGISQLACYVPIFGYRLEYFPFRSLRPGSIYEKVADGLNMKNPACFVYPQDNACRVGDHFPPARQADVERFAKYESFPFRKSTAQTLADRLSVIALALVLALLIVGTAAFLRKCLAARV